MSGQLEQILTYLDRDGVTELVISTGRPIAMKQNGAYVNLTARPLTASMLAALVEGTAIAAALPKSDGSQNPVDLDVGRRKLRVRTGRRGDEIVVRLEHVARPSAAVAAPAPRPDPKPEPKKPAYAAPELTLDDDTPELTLEPLKPAAPLQSPAPAIEAQYIATPRTGPAPPAAFAKLDRHGTCGQGKRCPHRDGPGDRDARR